MQHVLLELLLLLVVLLQLGPALVLRRVLLELQGRLLELPPGPGSPRPGLRR